MNRRYVLKTKQSSDFELDLAPLLAVMVKLVPVLLLSSAFVQLMIIEADVPQIVQEAINSQEKTDSQTVVSVEMHNIHGFKFKVRKDRAEQVESIASGDWEQARLLLEKIKSQNPDVFRIELQPSDQVDYQQIIKMMDVSRRSKTKTFPIKDPKSQKLIQTDYMFPEVLMANAMTGE